MKYLRQSIIITGSANEEKIKTVMKYLFDLEYDSYFKEYKSKCFDIYVNTKLNTSSFDLNEFQKSCKNYNVSLNCIICIENLNPRPETLLNDLEILSNTFKTNDLRDKLNILFTSSNENIDLNSIRNESLSFNVLFDNLLIINQNKKKKYVENNIFCNNLNDLKGKIMRSFYKSLSFKMLIFILFISSIIALVLIIYFSHCCSDNSNSSTTSGMGKIVSNKTNITT